MTWVKPFLICSGLRETELRAVLPEDRASSQYDSFNEKMVLKRPFVTRAVLMADRAFS